LRNIASTIHLSAFAALTFEYIHLVSLMKRTKVIGRKLWQEKLLCVRPEGKERIAKPSNKQSSSSSVGRTRKHTHRRTHTQQKSVSINLTLPLASAYLVLKIYCRSVVFYASLFSRNMRKHKFHSCQFMITNISSGIFFSDVVLATRVASGYGHGNKLSD